MTAYTGIHRHETTVWGHQVRYGVAGSGSPLVLVHGLSGSWRWWRPVLPALADHREVFLVDLPGFGDSGKASRLPLAGLSSWLIAWMDAVELSHVHLAGYSMGGFIAMQVAATRPDLVDKLVLVAPTGVPDSTSVPGQVLPLLRTGLSLPPRFLPLLVYDALRAGPRTLLRTARDVVVGDIRPQLSSLTAPTLLIWGERDLLVSPQSGELLHRLIPNSHLVVLPAAGHVPMFGRPHEFADAVLGFLAGRPVGGR